MANIITILSSPLNKRWKGKFVLLCVSLLLSACNVDLYNNLSQKQANEIITALYRQGIPAERDVDKDNKYIVRVDKDRFAEAVSILKEQGLPKQDFDTLGGVFQSDGIVASPVQERAQMIYALSQELARTISDIDGVITARVHLVLPENDPLRQHLIPSSASVFIRHKSSTPIANLTPQIKLLVANGIAGLSYDKVSVALVPVDPPPSFAKDGPEMQLVSFFGVWISEDSVQLATLLILGIAMLSVLAGGTAIFFFANQGKRRYLLTGSEGAKS